MAATTKSTTSPQSEDPFRAYCRAAYGPDALAEYVAPRGARSAYSARVAAVDALLDRLDVQMAAHRNVAGRYPEDWGYAGDIAHVEELLTEVVAFLGGEA